MTHNVVAVVGGGAAGLMAAITAARAGARVVLLEGNDRVGKKLLTTGNGRCNLTNVGANPADYHGSSRPLVEGVLPQFEPTAAVAFFEAAGVACVTEERGRVFPRCGQASAVLDVLRFELDEAGVEVRCGAEVRALERAGAGFALTLSNGSTLEADRVVLATGGRAAPGTGSRGQGYELARALGHAVVAPFPALVQLRLASPHLKALAGVRINARVTVRVAGQPDASATDEVLFTEYGVSGPAILAVSRVASEAVAHARRATLTITLLPDLDAPAVAAELQRRAAAHPERTLQGLLVGLVHKRLIVPLLKEAGLPPDGPSAPNGVEGGEALRILGEAGLLTAWTFEVTATTGWTGAQVTAGGVASDEVDPRTLESRKVPGLFFAGEVLDVDGDSGGYNLQWAWASGVVAGRGAAGVG